MNESDVLKPWNQCPLTSIERVVVSKRIGPLKVYIYKDSFKQYRIVLKHINKDINISAILFDQFKTETHSYTLEEYREHNYKRDLFTFIQTHASKSFKLSKHDSCQS